MTHEDSEGISRTDSRPVGVDIDSHQTPAYHDWSSERLVAGYRRNSVLLGEYGADERTIRTLCAIEERLRARNIDPDEIVEELDA
jgi:uncharacterized protein CbrC (UPF0167 family)